MKCQSMHSTWSSATPSAPLVGLRDFCLMQFLLNDDLDIPALCFSHHKGPTLLLTSDIIRERLGASALDRLASSHSYLIWPYFVEITFSAVLILISVPMILPGIIVFSHSFYVVTVASKIPYSYLSASMSTACLAGWPSRRISIELSCTRLTTA